MWILSSLWAIYLLALPTQFIAAIFNGAINWIPSTDYLQSESPLSVPTASPIAEQWRAHNDWLNNRYYEVLSASGIASLASSKSFIWNSSTDSVYRAPSRRFIPSLGDIRINHNMKVYQHQKLECLVDRCTTDLNQHLLKEHQLDDKVKKDLKLYVTTRSTARNNLKPISKSISERSTDIICNDDVESVLEPNAANFMLDDESETDYDDSNDLLDNLLEEAYQKDDIIQAVMKAKSEGLVRDWDSSKQDQRLIDITDYLGSGKCTRRRMELQFS